VEVSKRSLGLRHRDAVAASRNTGNEGGGSVDRDAAALPASGVARQRDVDGPVMWLQHSPDSSRAEVAHRRSLTEGKQRRHAPAFEVELGVADRVNTAMKSVKPPGLRALRDSLIADPGLVQLTGTDHAHAAERQYGRSSGRYWRVPHLWGE
jgi:hypothetical protein